MTYEKTITNILKKPMGNEFWKGFKDYKYPFIYFGCNCTDKHCRINVITLIIECGDSSRHAFLKGLKFHFLLYKIQRYIAFLPKIIKYQLTR